MLRNYSEILIVRVTSHEVFVTYSTCLLRYFCWKRPIFQSKQAMNKQHHISLNSQFIVVLNSTICFSIRFCNNSLLVLKIRFQVFSFSSKKALGFSSDRKILMSLLSVLFHIQNRVSVFWLLAKIFGETLSKMSLKLTSFPIELWLKPFISWAKQIKRNLRLGFVEERQLKTIMPK